MTPFAYPAGSHARALATEAEILRTLALCAKHGQPAEPAVLDDIAARIADKAHGVHRVEHTLDEIVADAMADEQAAATAAARDRTIAALRALATNPGRICPTTRGAP